MDAALTPEERERFVAHLRPLVERGRGVWRMAHAFLWARKRASAPSSNEPIASGGR
jgi:hypothetical protein